MRTTTIKLGLPALMAAMLLASALSAASARNLEVSNQNWRVTWSRLEFENLTFTLRCQVTFEGSFHSRIIPKVARLLIGAITRITIKEESCSGGSISPDRPPPWHLTYEGFTGRLPTIETLRLLIQRLQIAFRIVGITCKYGRETDGLAVSAVLGAAGEIRTFTPLPPQSIVSLLEGLGACPQASNLVSGASDGRVTLLNSTALLTIRLI